MSRGGITVSAEALAEAEQLLAHLPGGVEAAFSRAVNRGLASGRTHAVRAVREDYFVKARDVRETIAIQRATKANPGEGALITRGPPRGLHTYRVRPTRDTTGAARKRLKAAVKKGPLKPLGSSFNYRGNTWTRLGTRSLPLKRAVGPSIPQTMNNPLVAKSIEQHIGETTEKRLDHEVTFLLSPAGAASLRKKGGR